MPFNERCSVRVTVLSGCKYTTHFDPFTSFFLSIFNLVFYERKISRLHGLFFAVGATD